MTKSNLFKVLELYWLKLSNIGITKGLNTGNIRKIILLNRILTIALALIILLILKSLAAGLYQEALIQASSLPLYLLCYYFNYVKQYSLARLFTIISATLYLLSLALLWGQERGSHLILYPVIGLIIVFFEKRIFIFIFWVIVVFRNILLKIHQQSLQKQNEILDHTLSKWKKNNNQIDDVLVLGIRV